ncbi:uncharacterized protein [Branchiostoma lanceolatum]|uniref:uncharacterized protein n=1 Tax=Branchiostoma lanceolatum TaxID=7740 RepID=UPI003451A8B2
MKSGEADSSEGTIKLFQDANSEDQKKGRDWRLWIKGLSGVAACVLCGLFHGPVPALSRYVQDRGYTPLQIIVLVEVLIFLGALCIALYQRTDMLPKNWKDGAHLLFQGLTRFTSMLCLFTAHQFIPPANSEVVWNACKPVFVATLSCIIFQETPTRVTVFGSTWCVAGVVLLGYGSFVNTGSSTDTADVTFGMVLTVTGALIHAMMNVGAKVLLKSTSRAKVVTYTYVISAVSAGVGAGVTRSTWYINPETATILALILGCYIMVVLFFYIGLKLVEVNQLTALYQFSAFSAYGVQQAMLGFAPTILEYLGLTCVLIGTFSIMILEVLARWKEEKHGALVEQLHFNVTPSNDS